LHKELSEGQIMETSFPSQFQLEIKSFELTPSELEKALAEVIDLDEHLISFSEKPPLVGYRSVDPTILVAAIGGGGVALTALINGLLKILENQKNQRIIFESKDGMKLDIPVNCPPEQIEVLIRQIRYMDSPRILIPGDQKKEGSHP
jgi:hypothetical protein